MSRTCTVCIHPDRGAIDTALIGGEPVRAVASRYVTNGRPLGRMAMQRHKDEHLPQTLAKAKAAKEINRADDLLDEVQRLKAKSISLLLAAERAGDYRTALAGIREARACLELLLECENQLNRAPVVNLLITSPEWLATRSALLVALRPFAEARAAVVAALLQLEAGQ